MKLTKYTHACVRLDDGDRAVVIDPGVFSELDVALAGVDAVLITHEHPDHVDVDRVIAAATDNQQLRIWAPDALASTFAGLGERFVATEPGQSFDAAGFAIQTFGGQHALIHPSVPTIANVGYLINGTVYHPGDSFTVPTAPVQTLLVPIHAPWSKFSEVADFVIAVRAAQAFQIHDSLLSQIGTGFFSSQLPAVAGPYGTEYRHLQPAENLTV